ncbi:hypothetical protein [Lyngbya aestuarii]|uniref:hypothetical protein n=1 Tax=Lyngbya aestuarii TaxID=118322 RepID=UPI00403DD36A
MSQNKSVESSSSLPNPSINPVLQAALSSLDVHLEEELARYRRQQAGRPVTRPRGLGRNQARKPLKLISLSTAQDKNQPLTSGKLNAASTMTFPLALLTQTPQAEPSQETPKEPTSGSDQSETANTVTSEFGDTPVTESSTTEVKDTSELTLSEQPTKEGEDLVNSAPAQGQPDDYLESSEKLLESLGEEEAATESPERSTNILLTPLAVGSMLLLLLLCSSLVYIATNQSVRSSVLSVLGLSQSGEENSTQSSQTNGDSVQESQSLGGPNLANKEFEAVNLDTLPRLEAAPTPTPEPVAVPVLPDLPSSGPEQPNYAAPSQGRSGDSSSLSQALLPSAPQPRAVRQLPAPPLTPLESPSAAASRQENPTSPTATQQQAATSTSQDSNTAGGDKYYYVLINYKGDQSLAEARQIVPDAYVRQLPQGTLIQMGALEKEADARSLVNQLQQQGISASIYHP